MSLFESIFNVDAKNLSTHKRVPTSSQGVSFPLLSFQSGSKNVNKRQYLGIRAFHIPLRVQMYVLKQTKEVWRTQLSSKLHSMSVERGQLETKKPKCYKLQSHERRSRLIER